MKIVKVEDLHCDAGWRVNSFLKVTTDEGIVGWSEYMEGYGAQGLTAVPVREQLEALCALVPTDQAIAALTSPADLKDADVKIARIALLTRPTCALSSVSGRVRNCGACGTIAAPRIPRRLCDLLLIVVSPPASPARPSLPARASARRPVMVIMVRSPRHR